MVTGVTSTSNNYSTILTDIMAAENKETTAQQQVSTGKKGDDLSAFGNQTQNLVATNTVKAQTDGLVDQLNQLSSKLTYQQNSLTQIDTVAGNLKQALTEALADGSGDDLMNQVQSYFSEASDALNSQYDGDYIFSGGQTQTQPFTATDLTTLASAPVSSFFQNGTLTPTNRIDQNTSIQTGFNASDIGGDLMQVFQDIQTFQAGTTGNFGGNLTDTQSTFIQNELNTLGGVVTSTTNTAAQGGDIQNQVDAATTTQTDRQTTLTNMLGDITNVDEATAASDLTQAQTAVQASAQVFMTLNGMSLLNYLSDTSTTA